MGQCKRKALANEHICTLFYLPKKVEKTVKVKIEIITGLEETASEWSL